jgi:hypothetical protein
LAPARLPAQNELIRLRVLQTRFNYTDDNNLWIRTRNALLGCQELPVRRPRWERTIDFGQCVFCRGDSRDRRQIPSITVNRPNPKTA